MFMTDIISEDYKMWGHNSKVILDAPTGSGKSTLIHLRVVPICNC